jgi:cytochrome c oxidase subunit 2
MTNSRTRVLYAVALAFALSLAGCHRAVTPPKRIQVIMKKYTISPAEIRMKQGETVQLEVTTADVQHGFGVEALGIEESVQPGKPAVFLVTADKKGEFAIHCSVVCGPGHDDMAGKLVVE